MVLGFFKKKSTPTEAAPKCIGLGLGHSFEVDKLFLKIVEPELLIESAAATQIITSVGHVDLDGVQIFRFYTDDEAFLQVATQGGTALEHVIDVKLFHYYDTFDVSTEADWNELLRKKIGTSEYALADQTYQRVWESSSEYHQPVHMREKTFEKDGSHTTTDQFTMLFERELSDGATESLFLSAEEYINDNNVERCFVRSTGISLSSSQLTIHG